MNRTTINLHPKTRLRLADWRRELAEHREGGASTAEYVALVAGAVGLVVIVFGILGPYIKGILSGLG